MIWPIPREHGRIYTQAHLGRIYEGSSILEARSSQQRGDVNAHLVAAANDTQWGWECVCVQVLRLLQASPEVKTLDITGGAPELHPEFRRLVVAARALGVEVIDRCNLTVLSEDGQEDLAQFLAAQQVRCGLLCVIAH